MKWWEEAGGFFGPLYKEADDSSRTFFGETAKLDERTVTEVDGVERLCGLAPGSKIVDCPCGYGRHSVELAARGNQVTGVDVNNSFLQLAAGRATEHGAKLSLRNGDMRDLPADLTDVDAVINMFYSFGFFDDPADDLETLRSFHRVLAPGGRFLMHTMITEPAFEDGRIPRHEERELSSGRRLIARRQLNPVNRREEGIWELVGADGRTEQMTPYSVRIYTADEFTDLCLRAGFREVTNYGDWDGAPYLPSSPYLIAVATK